MTADDLVRVVTAHVRAAASGPGGWRAGVDGLRPVTSKLWAALPTEERRALLAGPARRWEVLRHRMAPEVADAVDRLLAAGSFVVRKGQVLSAAGQKRSWQVTLRGNGDVEHLSAAALVNCTGPSCDITRYPGGVGRRLVAAGYVVRDELDLGVRTTDDGAVIDADGRVHGRLWAVGALRRGSLYESTAMPELRTQAAAIAERLSEVSAVSSLPLDRREPASDESSSPLRASAGHG